jgi:hypothetical protein
MPAPVLTFLAPPSFADDFDEGSPTSTAHSSASRPAFPTRRGGAQPRAGKGGPAAALRMTHGAREAASGMKVTDADIRRCLDAPDEVSPDSDTPSRTEFRRGSLVVFAGADGMVLRVNRRR